MHGMVSLVRAKHIGLMLLGMSLAKLDSLLQLAASR